nr:hypothetical protein [Tanacetum cinerariifolium]
TSTSNDSPLVGVNTPRSDKDRLEIMELTFFVLPKTNDVTRLQALVNKRKVVITEATIRDPLRLDDAEGVHYLPNEEIFAELAGMGYEKTSTKFTLYKAFFSIQWKFLIHTILQSLSAKRTSWNEFSLAMASAVICLSTGRKFNFSKYIFESLVRNVDSGSKFYMYPRFIQLIIQNQLGDLSTHTTKYTSPALTQKVFANMRRVGKGFSGVDTPLFEGMLVAGVIEEECDANEQVQDVAADTAAQEADNAVQRDDVHELSIPSPTLPTPPPQTSQYLPSTSQVQHTPPPLPHPKSQPQSPAQPQAADFPMSLLQEALDACAALTRRVEHLEYDKVAQTLEITKLKRRVKKLEKANKVKGRMIDDLDRDTSVSLMDDKETKRKAEEAKVAEVVTAASKSVIAASTTIVAAEPQVPATTITVVPKKQHVEMDEEYARKLHEELNKHIDWNAAIDHVKQKAKEDPFVQRYQVMKKRPQIEAQARRNMIMYLKNVAGFRLDYFKGISYDDIRPIFEAKFNSNIEFLLKTKEQLEEEENRAIQSINETPA